MHVDFVSNEFKVISQTNINATKVIYRIETSDNIITDLFIQGSLSV
jgi:hypothetical protein